MVARIFQLPIAVEYRPIRFSWTLTEARVLDLQEGKAPDGFSQASTLVRRGSAERPHKFTAAPADERCVTLVLDDRFLPAPIAVQHHAHLKTRSKKNAGKVFAPLFLDRFNEKERQFVILSARIDRSKRASLADPWLLRDELLSLKRNDSALLDFLNKWGEWNDDWTDVKYKGYLRSYVLPAQVWEYQDVFRRALTEPPESWLRKHGFILPLPRETFPYHVIEAEDCVEAITTTITMDLLRRAPFGVCVRPDCRTPFVVESRHARQYCTKYCAHLESVRRNRRLKSNHR